MKRPLVSVLMPSRGRADLAKQAINSLGKGDYEVIIGMDADDPSIDELKDHNPLIFAERHGYGALHEYYNQMSQVAKGDWLMLFNDDAIMETPNWTGIIAPHNPHIPQVLNVWQKNTPDNLFPLISRKWYEIVGHFSLNAHADSWVQQIGERLGNQVHVPGIRITHQGENLNDQTHNEARQIVRQTSAVYRGMEKERIEDANKIKAWCDANNIKL